jgi:hypothetical protein
MKMAHGDCDRLVVLIEGSSNKIKISLKDEMLELTEEMVESASATGSNLSLRMKLESTSGGNEEYQGLCAPVLVRKSFREDVRCRQT